MLPQTALAAAFLAATVPVMGGAGGEANANCSIQIGPGERFVQGRDAVVQPGEHLQRVTALRGRVVVRTGAEVDEAMALGGDLVLEPGARVNKSVTSVGGNVVLQGDAWVGENAVALGGEVQRGHDAWVGGNVIALAVKVGDQSLAQSITQKLGDLARCQVVQVHVRTATPEVGSGAGKTL
jgi:NDP-sugar pyrophosphorylase family protein